DEIQERQLEILGRGEIHIGHQRAGVFRFGRLVKAPDEAFDARFAVPTHDGRGNLVADHEAKHGGMAREARDIGAQLSQDTANASRVVEEGDVLLPRQPDHDAQVVGHCNVHQPARRKRIDADRIEAGGRDRLEVALDDSVDRELNARAIRPERPVGDATDPEFLITDIQKLAADIRPLHLAMPGRRSPGSGVPVEMLAGEHLVGRERRDPLERCDAHTSSGLTLTLPSRARGASCFPCQSHAVRTIVWRSDICGTQCSVACARRGSATSAAGSPARRAQWMTGTGLPPTASTAVMTSRIEYPRPVPRLTLTLGAPTSRCFTART